MHSLTYRKVLQINGHFEEIIAYLQGVLSCDTNLLKSQSIIYGLLLTPQGKIITDIFIYKGDESIFMDVMAHCHQDVMAKMQMYAIGRQIEVEQTDFFITISSDENPDTLDQRLKQFGRQITDSKSVKQQLYKQYRMHLMQNLIPEFDDDMQSCKFFPLDFAMDQIAGSISYDKGCYVGQEVTARSKYRGVKRKELIFTKDIQSNDVVINKQDEDCLILRRLPK